MVTLFRSITSLKELVLLETKNIDVDPEDLKGQINVQCLSNEKVWHFQNWCQPSSRSDQGANTIGIPAGVLVRDSLCPILSHTEFLLALWVFQTSKGLLILNFLASEEHGLTSYNAMCYYSMVLQATVCFMDGCSGTSALCDNPLFGSSLLLHEMEEGRGQCSL